MKKHLFGCSFLHIWEHTQATKHRLSLEVFTYEGVPVLIIPELQQHKFKT